MFPHLIQHMRLLLLFCRMTRNANMGSHTLTAMAKQQ